MKRTQKEIILEYLKSCGGWVVSWQLIKNQTPYGWLGSGSDRIARYMVDPLRPEFCPDIQRKRDGKFSYYRYSPQPKQAQLNI